ncbi:hypothetical protein ACLOJK_040257 [Asimina triloba]
MLQDNLRSAVYSSLKKRLHVPFEGSNEAGQCRTDRQSKTNSTDVMTKRSTGGNLHSSSSFGSKEEEETTMPLPSFHLKQVSQGADKLNMMIESWSRGMEFDRQSGDIARDLLRGALDLQESLLMLEKLQEASKLTAHAKRKHKVSIGKEEDCLREVGVYSFRDQNRRKHLEKPRNSVDGYSRNFHRLRDSLDGSSNFVAPRHSVDGCSRNGFERRKSMDVFPTDFVGRWNSLDGSSRNGIELRRSVDGCSRTRIEPRRSADWFSRDFEGPRNSVDGSARNGIEIRKSVDSSSRDCIEELKKVLRESLHKQNHLPAAMREEMPAPRRFSCDSFPGGPIASSTRSPSSYDGDRKVRSYDSLSSSSRKKEVKMPNLIAKLMGLEELPSETTPQGNGKNREAKNTLFSCRPAFDIDMPKGRKSEFAEQKVDPEHNTLKEIIETMQFKGLLKSNHAEGHELRSSRRLVATSDPLKEHNRKGLDMKISDDELPPIVIIKPLRFSHSKDEVAESKQTLDKLGLKETKILGTRNESLSKIESEILEATMESSKKIEAVPVNCEELMKEKTKTTKTEMQKPLPERRILAKGIDKITSEEKQKNMQSADESPNPDKASIPSPQKKKDAVKGPKKAQEIHKTTQQVVRAPKKAEEQKKQAKEIRKSVPESQAPTKKIFPKPSKPENRAIPTKSHASRQKNTSQNLTTASSAKPMSQNSKQITKKNRRNTTKPTNESAVMNSASVIEQSKEGNTNTDPICEIRSESTTPGILPTDELPTQKSQDACQIEMIRETPSESGTTGIFPAVQLPTQTTQDASHIQIEGDDESKCEIVCEAARNKGSFESGTEASANNKEQMGKTNRPDLRQLLLSSPSFTNSAEELFDLHIDQNIVCHANDHDLAVAKSSKFLLDCVKEIMGHKHRRGAHWKHPLVLLRTHGSELDITVGKLLDELIDGIENLEYYSKVGAGGLGKDGLYCMLGRDLRCEGLVGNGVWDLGWSNGFSLEDADEVASEVEQNVFSFAGIVTEMGSHKNLREAHPTPSHKICRLAIIFSSVLFRSHPISILDRRASEEGAHFCGLEIHHGAVD